MNSLRLLIVDDEPLMNAIAGGVYELELRGGQRVKTGRQHSDSIRRLLKAGR